MNKMENYLVEFGEELGKEGYSIIKAGVNTLLKAKSELAAYTIDNYMNTRFNIRLEYFAYEQEQLNNNQKQNFYKDINYKQLNYLFELLERARTSTYDLHAKILAKLYPNLIKNGDLNYFENNLFVNLNLLNEQDIESIYEFLKEKKDVSLDDRVKFPIENYEDDMIFEKCVQIGILKTLNLFGMDFENKPLFEDKICFVTGFGEEFYNILDEIIDN